VNRSTIQRWAIMWAASGMTISDLEEFLEWVGNSDQQDVIRSFSRVRNQIRHLERALLDDDDISGTSRRTTIEYDSLVRDVQRLISNSDLSTEVATTKISDKLAANEPHLDVPKFSPKEGLRRWLIKLARQRGSGKVLSATLEALRVPGGSAESDWRLG
jgi:hypothetical protein